MDKYNKGRGLHYISITRISNSDLSTNGILGYRYITTLHGVPFHKWEFMG